MTLTIIRELARENRELWSGSERKELLLKWTICLGILSGVALSPRLWFGPRALPTIPVFPNLPDLPTIITIAISILFVLVTLLVAIVPKAKTHILVATTIVGVLILFDINRLQPWVYMYILMLVSFTFPGKDKICANVATIIALTYTWSGIQKLNLSFAADVFPWMFGEKLTHFWFVPPILEIGIGICLLIPKVRLAGLIGAIGINLSMLYMLGPLNQNFNSVVWPWNVCLLVASLIVFLKSSDAILLRTWETNIGKFIIILVGIMPGFNFIGMWDDYLSAQLYAGSTKEGYVLLTPKGLDSVPKSYRPYVTMQNDRTGFDLIEWSSSELNVPIYPEFRVYRVLVRKLVEQGIPESEMTLIVNDRPAIWNSKVEYRKEPVR